MKKRDIIDYFIWFICLYESDKTNFFSNRNIVFICLAPNAKNIRVYNNIHALKHQSFFLTWNNVRYKIIIFIIRIKQVLYGVSFITKDEAEKTRKTLVISTDVEISSIGVQLHIVKINNILKPIVFRVHLKSQLTLYIPIIIWIILQRN